MRKPRYTAYDDERDEMKPRRSNTQRRKTVDKRTGIDWGMKDWKDEIPVEPIEDTGAPF